MSSSNTSLWRSTLLLLGLVLLMSPSSALVKPNALTAPAADISHAEKALRSLSVEDFLALTPKKYRELTGEKLSIPQRISLKIAQKKMEKALRNHESVDTDALAAQLSTSDFNIGGFVLGLLLAIIGVLIAYLIGDSSVIKWAWIGFGVFLVIFLLTIIL